MIRERVYTILLLCAYGALSRHENLTAGEPVPMTTIVKTVNDVDVLFPKYVHDIDPRTDSVINRVTKAIQDIIDIAPAQKTFDNTARAFDHALLPYHELSAALHTLEMVSPDTNIREASHQALIKLQKFSIYTIAYNIDLYQALKSYADKQADTENLTEEERYFVTETIKDFEKSGLNLPEKEQEKIKELKQELGELSLQFQSNINNDNRTITVTREELAGTSSEFIDSLQKTPDGNYLLGVDYPTYHMIMENCSVETTRKALWTAFNNRAYPENQAILEKIIALRDQLAHALGYSSYAELDIDDEMAKNPIRVEQFLADLEERAKLKVNQEVQLLSSNLPTDVSLTVEGTFKPWDLDYIKTHYKREHLAIDEQAIAEYFPLGHTLEQLLDIYAKFFSIRFEQITAPHFWHPDVKLLSVYDNRGGKLLGYILLDLFPRPNKYTHACQIDIVVAMKSFEGHYHPAVAVVLANFPQSTPNSPALLPRQDVITFFHEFGHALHSILGATEMGSFSGTSVKRDFVELPSQMLEEWMWNPEMLKKVSRHYKTGLSLPDEVIQTILQLKHFDGGQFVLRQIALSKISLEFFGPGQNKDITTLARQIFSMIRHVYQSPDNHFVASFGHLTGYGAKYYGYLWSRVFALDLFETIKQHGLLNPEIGHRYVQEVIGKGGSKDPEELLKNFLGRDPRNEAFLKDLGLA